MRRALPWALVALLLAGVGLGMGIGISDESPSAGAQFAEIVRTTEEAGTARFTATSVTTVTGSSALQEKVVATGEINFETDSLSVTLRYPPTETHEGKADVSFEEKMIKTGPFMYVYVPSSLASGSLGTTTGPVAYSWEKEPLSTGSRRRSSEENSLMNLLGLPGSTKALQDLGPSTVGGQATSEYQIGSSPCQSPVGGLTETYSTSPTTLWVDSHGRLIQGEVTQTAVIRPPKGTDTKATGYTETAFIRLFGFGTPANITAPPNATKAGPGTFATSACS